MIRHLSEEEFAVMEKRVHGGVVGTRHKVRRQLDPLKRATDAKSNIPPTIGTVSGLCIRALGVTAGSNPAHAPYKL